jgi:putative ABC transport system permease protein
VTYALEAVAVLIGLVGIACAGAANALARRGEFGMLRHLGMLRRQIVTMLAAEGLLVSALAALYGLVLGGAISLVLVHVVNRQSFHWSIDLAVPVWQLVAFATVLLLSATVTNVISARAALGTSALRAVREDW